MPSIINIHEFLLRANTTNALLLDVRSPGEYRQGHIPGAVNCPVLNDEERHIVGITYKHKGRKAAVIKGFDLVGYKFSSFIAGVNEIYQGNDVLLYCWRGGMRSNIMAWLLQLAGYNVFLLEKGYKSFRHYVIEIISGKFSFLVLGGKTGSGKTDLLNQLENSGEQVIDLEDIACHKGSAFGSLGMPSQPTNEHFENKLAVALAALDKDKHIWIENESRNIGGIKIPDNIFNQIRNSPVFEINIPFEKRLNKIINDYGCFPLELLKEKSLKIERKLGPDNLKIALQFLERNNLKAWAEILLNYYDRNYEYSNSLRPPGSVIPVSDAQNNAELLVTLKEIANKTVTDENIY